MVWKKEKLIFLPIFLTWISSSIAHIELSNLKHDYNYEIQIEGSMSQNFDLGPIVLIL